MFGIPRDEMLNHIDKMPFEINISKQVPTQFESLSQVNSTYSGASDHTVTILPGYMSFAMERRYPSVDLGSLHFRITVDIKAAWEEIVSSLTIMVME